MSGTNLLTNPPKKGHMKLTIQFLREREWSFGNGQCPECSRCRPNDWGWGRFVTVGHKAGCTMALALEEVGETVDYEATVIDNRWLDGVASPFDRKTPNADPA